MAPKAPYHSVGGAPDNALFNVDSGAYVVTTPTAAASTEYNAGGTQPDPAATTTAGTGMTLQVKVETVGGVQRSQVFRF